MVREPAVAGRFYGAASAPLAREVDGYLSAAAGPGGTAREPAIGLIAPHAGYVYSGAIAGAAYARVAVPARVLVLGPNHTGLGAAVALWPGGAWRTPLGDVPVDAALTAALAPAATADTGAHGLEHSLEVQVPFLQRAHPGVRIAALCLSHLSFADCERLGRTVAAASREADALVVASSDMSHYVSAATARTLDHRALDRVLALDPAGLYEVVHRDGITMCGIIPATVMLLAALERGATRAELVRYGHSGEVTGDDRSVVGYAAVVVR